MFVAPNFDTDFAAVNYLADIFLWLVADFRLVAAGLLAVASKVLLLPLGLKNVTYAAL